jgi:hypothetical protein
MVSGRTGTVRYQVLVIIEDDFCFASVPDLKCEAVGTSVDDAIGAVYDKALRKLHEHEDGNGSRPPSRLILDEIDLPRRDCRKSDDRRLTSV